MSRQAQCGGSRCEFEYGKNIQPIYFANCLAKRLLAGVTNNCRQNIILNSFWIL